jgi:hypothetical protein
MSSDDSILTRTTRKCGAADIPPGSGAINKAWFGWRHAFLLSMGNALGFVFHSTVVNKAADST